MPVKLTRLDLPAVLLAVLEEGPNHGYGIARLVESRTDGQIELREGSLYPALRSLEQTGHVSSRWDEPASGPARKLYVLTPAGRKQRDETLDRWRRYCQALSAVLERNNP